MVRKILLFLVFLILLFCDFFQKPVFAAEQFRTNLTISYEFFSDGTSKNSYEYSLTNLTSKITASAYEFDIIDASPQNLQAYDLFGKLDLKSVSATTGQTHIIIPFSQIAAGKGKTYTFNISYTGMTISKVDGLWKISLPISFSSQENQQTTVQLIIPNSFGQPLTLFPTTSSISKKEDRSIYTFLLPATSGNNGIYAIFGNLNLIGFNLSFTDVKPRESLEIPSDKPGQLVFIQKVDPIPENIIAASDGKWMIKYNKSVPSSLITGYLLVDATSSAGFPDSGHLSLHNLAVLPKATPGSIQINWHKPFQITPFFSFPGKISITNTGSQAVYHIPVKILPTNLRYAGEIETIIPVIPPFGQVFIPVNLSTPFFPDSNNRQLSISAGTVQLTYNIEAKYFIFWYAFISIFIIIIFFIMAWITYHTRGLYLQRRHR